MSKAKHPRQLERRNSMETRYASVPNRAGGHLMKVPRQVGPHALGTCGADTLLLTLYSSRPKALSSTPFRLASMPSCSGVGRHESYTERSA